MRRLLTPALLLGALLSGCTKPPTELIPFAFSDPAGDAPARFDIRAINFTELNGSLVLRVDLDNFAEGLPFVEARLEASTDEGRVESYAQLAGNPAKRTLPQVSAYVGRIVRGEHQVAGETCYLPSFPTDPQGEGPWFILVDLLHNMTGFEQGAKVRSVQIWTAAGLDQPPQDEARSDQDFSVRGGSNPHAEEAPEDTACPLFYEGRGRLY